MAAEVDPAAPQDSAGTKEPEDFTGALLEDFESLLESEERVVSLTHARYLTGEGGGVSADGPIQESDPGLLALTDRRVLFVGIHDERFALARDDIRSARIDTPGSERLRLRLSTDLGTAVLTDISAEDAMGMRELTRQAPRAESRVQHSLWSLAIVVSAAAAAVLVYADLDTPVRPLLVLWFMLFCPGMALVRLLRLRAGMLELAIGVALSLALDTLVAISLLYAGWANYDVMFTILLAVTLFALVLPRR